MFQFRNKRFEWERPVISVRFDNGKEKWWLSTEDVFYANFNSANLQRPSCFRCKYACDSRCGDITIGDFWGYAKAGLKMSVKEGVSCCLINTAKAESIFSTLNINSEKVNPKVIINGNSHLRAVSKKGIRWREVMDRIKTDGFEPLDKQYRKANKMTFAKAFVKKLILKRNF